MNTLKMFTALLNSVLILTGMMIIIITVDANVIKFAILGIIFCALNVVAILVGD